ncbi:MAG: cytidine deaminase [Oscillospiraceae bacterium]|jgi:cytidine deaminase|nr:cytidine deaminase [Oscillospiraceae bacterium]
MRVTDRELIRCAEEAKAHSYSPYSGFAVGAAIECADGEVFVGCNVENAAFGSTICAEAAVIAAAVAAGYREFRRIAISSDGTKYCMPCGNCRQLLHEFSPNIEVLAARADGRYVSYPLDKLLPNAFAIGAGD